MEPKEYQMGNILLKASSANVDMKVYKCPYLACERYFTEKEDLSKHRCIDHGEIISRAKPKLNFTKTFNAKDIDQILITVNRQRVRYYAMLIGELFEPKKKGIDLGKKDAPEKPKKAGILGIFTKKRDKDGGTTNAA